MKKGEEKREEKTIKQQHQQQQPQNENGCKYSKDISGTFSGVVGSVGSLPRRFPLFSFFCLLVFLVSDFCPDTSGVVVDTFFFFFRLTCSVTLWGGRDATDNAGMCSQCLSHAGHAPAHGAHCSGSRLLRREPSEAGPGLHVPPRSKPLRLGSQVVLRGADSVGPAFSALPRSE